MESLEELASPAQLLEAGALVRFLLASIQLLFKSDTPSYGQSRILREAAVLTRPTAQDKHRASVRNDPLHVAAGGTLTHRRAIFPSMRFPGHLSRISCFSSRLEVSLRLEHLTRQMIQSMQAQ